MLAAWIRLRSLAALLALGSLALAGCKQDVGERCEQNSDCASGICGPGGAQGMASAAGKLCVATLETPTPTGTGTGGTGGGGGTGAIYDAGQEAPEVGSPVETTTDGAADGTEAGGD
jgi:hypothetical protein